MGRVLQHSGRSNPWQFAFFYAAHVQSPPLVITEPVQVDFRRPGIPRNQTDAFLTRRPNSVSLAVKIERASVFKLFAQLIFRAHVFLEKVVGMPEQRQQSDRKKKSRKEKGPSRQTAPPNTGWPLFLPALIRSETVWLRYFIP